MKKAYILGLSLALTLVVSSVFAFGVPGVNTGSSVGNTVVNTAIDEGKNQVNKAVVDDLNTKLASLSASCKCNQKTGQITKCDFSKINKEIGSRQQAVKTFLNKSFRVQTEVAQACWSELESKVHNDANYWSWWNSKWVKTDAVSIRAVK